MKDSKFDDLTGVKLRLPPRWLTAPIRLFLKDAKQFYGVDEDGKPNRKKYRSDPIYTLSSPSAESSQVLGNRQIRIVGKVKGGSRGSILTKFESLPREILGLIAQALDGASRICLATTSTTMLNTLALDNSGLSRCERWLLMCRFETDSVTQYPKMYCCCHCKIKHPRNDFVASRWTQIGDPWRRIDSGRVLGNSSVRCCSMRGIPTLWLDRDSSERRWVQSMRLSCLHCRRDLSKDEHDENATGCDQCNCTICPRDYLPTYIRHGRPSKSGRHPQLESLRRIDARELWVDERGCR